MQLEHNYHIRKRPVFNREQLQTSPLAAPSSFPCSSSCFSRDSIVLRVAAYESEDTACRNKVILAFSYAPEN